MENRKFLSYESAVNWIQLWVVLSKYCSLLHYRSMVDYVMFLFIENGGNNNMEIHDTSFENKEIRLLLETRSAVMESQE